LSKRARSNEFAPLTDKEAAAIEQAYARAFRDVQDLPDELIEELA
jgi:hypothetical protein